MTNSFEKRAGLSLIIGALLMIITMTLHPVGGNIQQLLKITTIAIVSHSIAIFSIPFSVFGFWGITRKLGTQNPMSMLGFFTACIGLGGAVIAAALNGLALPFFVNRVAGSSEETLETASIIIKYGLSVNHAFDYIMIGGICTSFLIWSLVIIKKNQFPKWIAYLGLLLGLGFLALLFSGFVLVDLAGFRFFIFGIVIWILAAGIMLQKN
ncbi:MAG: hypothetical protein HWE07_05720 [Cytophagia bacterium]|nr:hypothetical protein [Cytophagia bacterium]